MNSEKIVVRLILLFGGSVFILVVATGASFICISISLYFIGLHLLLYVVFTLQKHETELGSLSCLLVLECFKIA